jgi:hypothetical protein
MDKVLSPDHDHSGDYDWDLPFPPNLGISDFHESLDGDRSVSEVNNLITSICRRCMTTKQLARVPVSKIRHSNFGIDSYITMS